MVLDTLDSWTFDKSPQLALDSTSDAMAYQHASRMGK